MKLYQQKKSAILICWGFILFTLVFLAAGTTWAENKALLIGVGDFKNPRIRSLEGIDLDINMMQTVAGYMGFKKSDIITLYNESATCSRVKKAFEEIARDAGTNDKVLIYFTTHGSSIKDQNDDEEDGNDEVIVLYDTDVVSETLTNALVDDDFYRYLRKIRSNQVLVIVDSCHSGTGTKSLRSMTTNVVKGQVKSFTYSGMGKGTRGFAAQAKERLDNYVSIAACRDDEESIASIQGSLFTLGVLKAVRNAISKGQITPMQIKQEATAFINGELPEDGFHPQLYGNRDYWSRTIQLKQGRRSVWNTLEETAQRAGNNLGININKSSYRVGDELVIKLNMPGNGYINIVSVSENDEPVILYPNKYNPDNYHNSGDKVVIPTPQMDFALVTQNEDRGNTLIFAMVTKENINFLKSGFKSADDVFARLSPKAMRKFAVVKRQQIWAGTCKTVIE